jgi:prevent-host-death family protein
MLTRNPKSKKTPPRGAWKLQDAKARFSEVVRKAQTEGPQHVTVHGKDAVVVLAAHDYAQKLGSKTKGLTGSVLVEAMQEARRLGLKIKPLRTYPAYRPPMTFPDDEA